MSTATLVAPQPVTQDAEQALSALATDVFKKNGLNYVRIEEKDATLLVMRIPHPIPVEKWSDVYPPEYAAELERRCANLGEGRVLFEITDYSDSSDEDESKQ